MKKSEKVKLEDIAEVIDCPHSTPKWADEGVFVVRNYNLASGRIKRDQISCVDEETYVGRTRRAEPRRGDCILSREAPIGTVGYINSDERMCLGQRVVLIRPKDNVDSRYLLYQLISPNVQNQFKKSVGSGSTVSNLRIPLIKSVSIDGIDAHTQEIIGSILGAYDDLIENNEKRIKALEEIARLLYVEWFVRFMFPGHEKVKMIDTGTEYGKVPEGWTVKTLSDVSFEKKEQVNPGEIDQNTSYVGLEHIPRKTIVISEWGKASDITSSKKRFQEGDVLFGKIRPYFHKVVIAPVNGITSSDTIVISALESKFLGIVLMCISSDNFVAYATTTSQGTKMPRAEWKTLKNYSIIVPADNVLKVFNKNINNWIGEMNKLMILNQNLAAMRDLLIKALMSEGRVLK